MLRPSKAQSDKKRWLWACLLGVLLQGPIYIGLVAQTGANLIDFARPHTKPAPLGAQFLPVKPKEEPDEEDISDKQVVTVPDTPPEPAPDKKPTETKLVADRKVRVKKQTRSKRKSVPPRHRKRGKARVKKPSKVQVAESDSPDPTVIQEKAEDPALPEAKRKLPKADRGSKVHDSVTKKGQRAKLFRAPTTDQAQRSNLQGISDSFATDDHLPTIRDTSQSTLLNTDKSKFSDFFYRVVAAVRRHWNPDRTYRRRDPTGKVYGVKDRHTVLKVTLHPSGKLKRLVTRKHSGLEFMDAEARQAMKQAQPFVNPPRGLVKNGEINFNFGFYFEISAGKTRFKWRRL